MNITLHWWAIPIVLALAAFGLLSVARQGRDYDLTPLFYAAGALCLVMNERWHKWGISAQDGKFHTFATIFTIPSGRFSLYIRGDWHGTYDTLPAAKAALLTVLNGYTP